MAKDRTGTKAGRVAAKLNEIHEAYWHGLAENRAVKAERAYTDAIGLARSLSLDYQAPTFIAGPQPIAAVLDRVEAAMRGGRMDNPGLRKAILGGVEEAESCSTLYAHYVAGQRIRISTKSRNQKRKFETQKSAPSKSSSSS